MPLFPAVSDLYRAICSALGGWSFQPVPASADKDGRHLAEAGAFSLWRTPEGETIVVCLLNSTLTGSERNKPQIRIFTDKARQAYGYAKAKGLRYFFLVYCATPVSQLNFSAGIDTSHYVASIESKLSDSTGGRLDIRSMYDLLETQNGREFFRVTSDMHRCPSLEQSAFIRICGNNGAFSVENLEQYLRYFDSRPYQEDAQVGTRPVYVPSALCEPDQTPLPLPWNLLVHGAPGTGKSHLLDRKVAECQGIAQVEARRVTFYEDYSYGQFVGEYMPVPLEDAAETVELEYSGQAVRGTVSGERIAYRFSPGPMAELLARSLAAKLNHEDRKFVLIIEELNRANAASAFGDFFQLLDRQDGFSIYEIAPQAKLAEYLEEAVSRLLGPSAPELPDGAFSKIKLPDNLYIWATMNSADQGVFPLDSAFKRRWSYIYCDIYTVDPANALRPRICLPVYDPDAGRFTAFQADWNTFRCAVNERILLSGFAEDRCIGYWFFSAEEMRDIEAYTTAAVENRNTGTGSVDDLPNPLVDKLFSYLLQDVFRNAPGSFFREGMVSLSQIRRTLKTLRLKGENADIMRITQLPPEEYVENPK